MQRGRRNALRLLGVGALAANLPIQVALAADAKDELAPAGKLRVAVAVAPAPSALYVVQNGPGSYRGVAVDIGKLLAKSLGVPVEFVPYQSSAEITAAADKNAWDVTFMPVDEERKKAVAFGAPYHILQSTYLVAPGADIKDLAAANRPGVRIGGVPGTTTYRASAATATQATHIGAASVAEALDAMKAGKIDAIALSRETLSGLMGAIPGARVLEGGFLNSTTAVALPLGKSMALAYVTTFIETAKASGAVRRAFDDIGLKTSVVAPAGMAP